MTYEDLLNHLQNLPPEDLKKNVHIEKMVQHSGKFTIWTMNIEFVPNEWYFDENVPTIKILQP